MCEDKFTNLLTKPPPPSWNDLLRMAQNARVPASRQHLSSCLELLLDYCSFSPSFSLLCDRLECIAYKEGFEFLTTPFTATDSLVSIFLSTPLFYIEVLAEDTTGVVTEVKMGYSDVVKSCTDMHDALKHNDFKCFIEHLNGFRDFISSDVRRLTYLENEIIKESSKTQQAKGDDDNVINANDYLKFISLPFGHVTPRIDGLPLRIYFFIDPLLYIKKCVKNNLSHISVITSKEAFSLTISTGQQQQYQHQQHFKMKFSQPIRCFKNTIESLYSLTHIQQVYESRPFSSPLENELLIENVLYVFQMSNSIPEEYILEYVLFDNIAQVSVILDVIKRQLIYNSLLHSCLKQHSNNVRKTDIKSYDTKFTFQLSINTATTTTAAAAVPLSSACYCSYIVELHFLFDDVFHSFSIDENYNVSCKSLTFFNEELYNTMMKKVFSIPIISRAIMKEIVENKRHKAAFEDNIVVKILDVTNMDFTCAATHQSKEDEETSMYTGSGSANDGADSQTIKGKNKFLSETMSVEKKCDERKSSVSCDNDNVEYDSINSKLAASADSVEMSRMTMTMQTSENASVENDDKRDLLKMESIEKSDESELHGDFEASALHCRTAPLKIEIPTPSPSSSAAEDFHSRDAMKVRILSPSQPSSASSLLSVDVLLVENSSYAEKKQFSNKTFNEAGESTTVQKRDDSSEVPSKTDSIKSEETTSSTVVDDTKKPATAAADDDEEEEKLKVQAKIGEKSPLPHHQQQQQQQLPKVKLPDVSKSSADSSPHSSSMNNQSASSLKYVESVPSYSTKMAKAAAAAVAAEDNENDEIPQEKVPVVKKKARKPAAEKKETPPATKIKIKPIVKPPTFEGGEENLQPPPVTLRIKRKRGRKPRPKVELIANLDEGSNDSKTGPIKIKISGLNLSKPPSTQKFRVKRKHEENAWPGPKKKMSDPVVSSPPSLPQTVIVQDEMVKTAPPTATATGAAPVAVAAASAAAPQESKSTLSTFKIPRKKAAAPPGDTRPNGSVRTELPQEMVPKFRPARQQSECGTPRMYPKTVISEPLPVYRGPQRIHSRSSSVSPRLPRNTPRNAFNGSQSFRQQPSYVYRPQTNNNNTGGNSNSPLMHNMSQQQYPGQNNRNHPISPAPQHNMPHMHMNPQQPQQQAHHGATSTNSQSNSHHPNGASATAAVASQPHSNNHQSFSHTGNSQMSSLSSHNNHQNMSHSQLHGQSMSSHSNSQASLSHQNLQSISHSNSQTNNQSMSHLNPQSSSHHHHHSRPRNMHSQSLARTLSTPSQHMHKARQQQMPQSSMHHQSNIRHMQQVNHQRQFISSSRPPAQYAGSSGPPRLNHNAAVNSRHQVETSDSALSPGGGGGGGGGTGAEYKPVEPPKIIPLERGQWRAASNFSNLEDSAFKH